VDIALGSAFGRLSQLVQYGVTDTNRETRYMAMKKTDLEKNKALKLTHSMKQTRSERFGKGAADTPLDRREQRKLDQAQGLVPFACKLNSELVEALKARAASHPEGLTGLLDELLRRGLAETGTDV
jgi:hypothetical protein